jgi:HD-GYP domain-containing protein (c-di-GMP phosphodiesterase class II)
MTSARAYRKIPLTKQQTIEEIKRNSGSQFDPKVVEAFLRVVDKL